MIFALLTVALPMDAPIIGGSGDFKYQYMPDLLKMPDGAVLVNAHGLVTDAENNIYLTYQNDGKLDKNNCLVRWKPDGTAGEFMTGGNATLCSGTPHGLTIATELCSGKPHGLTIGEPERSHHRHGCAHSSSTTEQFLYHANNNQKLTKTRLDGSIIWQRNGNFGQDPKVPYRPTWFAVPPEGDYIYLCDGYGSNNVYVFNRHDGTFMNKTFGGKGGRDQHGKFSTNHGCVYDPTVKMIAVSDRANSRFEFFKFDNDSPNTFEYSHTVDQRPYMGKATLPCNLRTYPFEEGRSISPDLNGPVAVLDGKNEVISVVNVSVLLKEWHHDHPHDAGFLANGDMIVATWKPGRLSYWKKI